MPPSQRLMNVKVVVVITSVLTYQAPLCVAVDLAMNWGLISAHVLVSVESVLTGVTWC